MKKSVEHRSSGGIRPEYDFSSMKNGVRGKHYEQYRKESNVVLLEPDVAEAFPTEAAVNEALRGILGTARAPRRTGVSSDRAQEATSRGTKRRSSRS